MKKTTKFVFLLLIASNSNAGGIDLPQLRRLIKRQQTRTARKQLMHQSYTITRQE